MKKLIAIAVIALVAGSMNVAAYAGKKCTPANKTATSAAIPDVALPFTFSCQHCMMKITIKTPADWSKSCGPCACGVTNLECYKQPKK